MLSNDFCFNTSDSLLGDANDDQHFDEFIQNCQAISHEFSCDETRDMSMNVENLYMDNDSDEFFIFLYKLFHPQNIFFQLSH